MSTKGFLVSQIGYDLGRAIRVIMRAPAGGVGEGAVVRVCDPSARGEPVLTAPLRPWGSVWGSSWWVADLSDLKAAGSYTVEVVDGMAPTGFVETLDVAADLLWDRTVDYAGVDQAERRARLAMNRIGWQDCGAAWQEANSHAAYVLGFCDLLDLGGEQLTAVHRERIVRQIVNGCDYLALLQDLAAEMGLGAGGVSHQKPKYEQICIPADVTKAAAAWASAARSLSSIGHPKCPEYIERANRSHRWLATATPVTGVGFSHLAHGAPAGYVPPVQWMTRDLLMMARSAVALAETGSAEFRKLAVELVEQVLRRQVQKARAQDDLFGHFYTFDEGELTEKAWIHQIDAGVIGCDAGGHYPSDLSVVIRMLRLWPDDPAAHRWRAAIRDHAYGFLLPACKLSPFLILPLGFYPGQGWLHFAGLWHGMNAAYAQTAAFARELATVLNDKAFDDVATGNLQWIAGLNAGLTAECLSASHMFSMDIPPGQALPVSQMIGIGRRCAGSWLNVRGSICNGFSTGDQFRFDVTPTRENDGPFTFTDEDWISHAGAWLSAISLR